MKLKFIFLLLVTAFTVSLVSFKKMHYKNETKYVTLNVTLARGTDYQLNLSQYGDADDIASIVTQSADYITSEIVKDAAGSGYIYKYLTSTNPKYPSVNHDTVVLKVSEPGCRRHHDETNISINFTFE
jgi:hypothetical protein